MSTKKKFDIDIFQSLIDNNDTEKIKKYCNNLKKFKLDEEYNLGVKDKIYHFNFIYSLPQDYKLSNYYNLFDFISDVIIKELVLKKAKITDYLFFIYKLSGLNKGQHILKKFSGYINGFDTSFKNNLLLLSASKGTLPVFLYWDKYTESNLHFNIDCLINSCSNTDSRVLSYILDNLEKYNLTNCMNEDIFRKMIMNLNFDFIPLKYFKRRLKWIDSKFNIKPYWKILPNYCSTKNFIEIYKYYYIPNISNENLLSGFCNLIEQIKYNFSVEEKTNFYNNIFKILNEYDKKKLNLLLVLMGEEIFNPKKDSYDYNDNSLIELFILKDYHLVNGIESNIFNFDNDLNFHRKIISSILKKNNFSYSFSKNWNKNWDIYYFLPFYRITKNKNINVLLRFFRKICKVYHQTNKLIKNYNNINNFKMVKDKFTKIPPSHILPDQFNKIKGEFLLRPKADGILVESLPLDCLPKSKITNYIIKAEYIEKLDLFLVFDINIPNKNSKERYQFLRKLHDSTNDKYNINYIETLEQLKNFNNQEDILLNEFLKLPYENYRWYPKISYNIDFTSFKNNIKILLKPTNEIPDVNTKKYLTDGYILVPLDGSRELKIKPKDLLTIDIKFLEDKKIWVDRYNKDLSYLVKTQKQPTKTSIWRCYPVKDNNKLYFVNKEIRLDKKKANPMNVIKDIINAYNWTSTNYYQKSEKPSNNTINLIENHNNKLKKIIKSISPKPNKLWLDLGCGKGKLIKMINKYNPLLYCGVDNDYNLLFKNKVEYKKKNIVFKLCDLNKDENVIKSIIPVVKFDYIVINFAINHFYSRNFWNLIKFYCKNTTKIIFNITNDNLLKNKIELEDNGFIKSNGNITTYKFPWVHKESMTEKFIPKLELEENINKSNFKIDKRMIEGNHNFEKIYTWYVLSS